MSDPIEIAGVGVRGGRPNGIPSDGVAIRSGLDLRCGETKIAPTLGGEANKTGAPGAIEVGGLSSGENLQELVIKEMNGAPGAKEAEVLECFSGAVDGYARDEVVWAADTMVMFGRGEEGDLFSLRGDGITVGQGERAILVKRR